MIMGWLKSGWIWRGIGNRVSALGKVAWVPGDSTDRRRTLSSWSASKDTDTPSTSKNFHVQSSLIRRCTVR